MEDEEEEEDSPAAPFSTAALHSAVAAPSNAESSKPSSLVIPSASVEPTTAPDTPRQTTASSASSDAGDWGLSPALGPSSPVGASPPLPATSSTAVVTEEAHTSPRASSDGTAASYDLVGERSGAPSSVGLESDEWTSRRGSKEGSEESVKEEEQKVVVVQPLPSQPEARKQEVQQEKKQEVQETKEESDEDSDWE